MPQEESSQAFVESITSRFDEIYRKAHMGFPTRVPGYEGFSIIRQHPVLAEQYLPLMEQTNDTDSPLLLMRLAPTYARNLVGVFKECPALLRIYGRLADWLPATDQGGEKDECLGSTRISTSADPDVVRRHLQDMKEIEEKLNEKVGPEGYKVVARPFDGMAEVRLTRLTTGKETRQGIYMIVVPQDGYLTPIIRRIYTSGLIAEEGDNSMGADMVRDGYLFKNAFDLDEEPFIKALATYEPLSDELHQALEDSGNSEGKYGRFAKKIFGEE